MCFGDFKLDSSREEESTSASDGAFPWLAHAHYETGLCLPQIFHQRILGPIVTVVILSLLVLQKYWTVIC